VTLRGAAPETVRGALERGDPLPGTAGFAGVVDGALVRDVLGRQPLFAERAGDGWAFAPTALEDPVRVPAGRVRPLDAGDCERAWTLPDPAPTADRDAAIARVREAVRESVEAVDGDGLAVAFSGGVDSGAVAAGVPEAPCYVAGFPDSDDVVAARDAAATMGRTLRVVELDHDDLERAVPAVARATGRTNPMDVAIALPLYLAAERAAADGLDRLALGQGADELFGGYAKVVDPADDDRVAATTTRGATREVILGLPAQLERDVLAVRAAGVEPVCPLLGDRVVAAALPLPGELLAADERKVALRRAVEGSVPASVARAEKTAVQYGSDVARELDRLARRAGFKRRMDDHLGQYLDALVSEAGVAVPDV
jgi:asparagine synthase (glutamine-hydrolysing)